MNPTFFILAILVPGKATVRIKIAIIGRDLDQNDYNWNHAKEEFAHPAGLQKRSVVLLIMKNHPSGFALRAVYKNLLLSNEINENLREDTEYIFFFIDRIVPRIWNWFG